MTRIVPVGYDGVTLPELYVDSPKLAQYVTPRIRVMRYGDIKAIKDPEKPREDEVPVTEAHALLRQAAAAEFSRVHVDDPTASYEVSFVELASTREYAEFAQLETVLLGDTVTVRHTDLGIALTARVVAYEYDPLQQAYLSVELGSTAAKFTSVTRQINTAITTAGAAADLAGVALASADGKATNHYGPNQPATARLGDTWFRDNGESTEIWVFQITDTGEPGWVALATDLNHAHIAAELETARQEVEQAKLAVANVETIAGTIAQRVEEAETDIGAARLQADEAHTVASNALDSVNSISLSLRDLSANTASAITALTNNINLRVTRDEVIAQINISPETILIDGKRIHLTGATTIDNATIKTAMIANAAITDAKIANLSAAKITTWSDITLLESSEV